MDDDELLHRRTLTPPPPHSIVVVGIEYEKRRETGRKEREDKKSNEQGNTQKQLARPLHLHPFHYFGWCTPVEQETRSQCFLYYPPGIYGSNKYFICISKPHIYTIIMA